LFVARCQLQLLEPEQEKEQEQEVEPDPEPDLVSPEEGSPSWPEQKPGASWRPQKAEALDS